MKKYFTYPFYQSLRFRFGLLFGLLFLLFLLGVVFFLYSNVTGSLKKSFQSRLINNANLILQKTEISPLIIPLPQGKEYFLISYSNTKKNDTLFNNIPQAASQDAAAWGFTKVSKTLETGGILTVNYLLPANDLQKSIKQLQLLLFIYVPVALIVSLVAGYFLSGFLLRPINHIISKASNINLQSEIKLLDEPETKDELHQLTVALNRMLARIQKQSQQQNAFFASASHELRTPLSNMLTELQVMQTTNMRVEEKIIFQNQLQEVHRLSKLVNDFLLMSQLKSAVLPVNKEIIKVVEICIGSIEKVKVKAKSKEQIFKLNLQPVDGMFEIAADKNHLSTIINNLLDNAVKYGQPSSMININICESEKNISVEVINKTDNDIQNAEDFKNEFHRQGFYKEGFGLGLWIVNQLVDISGGKLVLEFHKPYFKAELIFPLVNK